MSSGHLNAQYNLRLPDELKQKIAHSSKELNRSMNADIVARLEESFEQKSFESLESVPTEDLMKELAKRLEGFSVVANKK
ncbi:Arc family DNA-binding protein [Acinetobacter sp. ANC 5502]